MRLLSSALFLALLSRMISGRHDPAVFLSLLLTPTLTRSSLFSIGFAVIEGSIASSVQSSIEAAPGIATRLSASSPAIPESDGVPQARWALFHDLIHHHPLQKHAFSSPCSRESRFPSFFVQASISLEAVPAIDASEDNRDHNILRN